jgi:hypothetical protein
MKESEALAVLQAALRGEPGANECSVLEALKNLDSIQKRNVNQTLQFVMANQYITSVKELRMRR